MLRQGRSEFLLRAEPERERGRWSEEIKNREGVAAGGATEIDSGLLLACFDRAKK